MPIWGAFDGDDDEQQYFFVNNKKNLLLDEAIIKTRGYISSIDIFSKILVKRNGKFDRRKTFFPIINTSK